MARPKTILIANRGEIAVRIIRACKELGMRTAAIYSDADRNALHVKYADVAFHVGPAPSRESYLDVERVLDAAKRARAHAIHPGYGFLAENADFADAVAGAKLKFIGPPSGAIRSMGDKVQARKLMTAAGVPIIPGTTEPVAPEAAAQAAEQVGFPLMVKATAGGGGKGIRIVEKPGDLANAVERATAEAAAAFGNPAVYFERYFPEARHIEIQVLADTKGNVIHLGERDCSLQRRHQKVVEETPAPGLPDALRARMCEAAVAAARAVDCVSAGTVECRVPTDEEFYVLEMNTRLQVEHPVTEMVTGVDIVGEQINIAFGKALSVKQEDIVPRGVSIECRIYAEDPDNNFAPCLGTVTGLALPGGPNVRLDTAVFSGYEIPIHYDPMIGKLVVWGATRPEAIRRMQRALAELHIGGVKTNVPFLEELMHLDAFIAGKVHTQYLDAYMAGGRVRPREFEQIAAIAAALLAEQERRATRFAPMNGAVEESPWLQAGRASRLTNTFRT